MFLICKSLNWRKKILSLFFYFFLNILFWKIAWAIISILHYFTKGCFAPGLVEIGQRIWGTIFMFSFTQESFLSRLFEIGSFVLEKKILKFSLFLYYSPWKNGMALHQNKLEYPLYWNAFVPDLFEISQVVLVKKNLKFRQCTLAILLFSNYGLYYLFEFLAVICLSYCYCSVKPEAENE